VSTSATPARIPQNRYVRRCAPEVCKAKPSVPTSTSTRSTAINAGIDIPGMVMTARVARIINRSSP
jgi:hypothetical protein